MRVHFPFRTSHLAVGLFGLLAFVLTGQYMHHVRGHLHGMADGPRLLYRTSHIYLMWASLPNLLLGLYLQPPASGRPARLLWQTGSVLLLAAPVWIVLSFFLETHNIDLHRPLCRIAIETAFAGALMHGAAQWLARRHRPI